MAGTGTCHAPAPSMFDTGMNRLGLSAEEAVAFCQRQCADRFAVTPLLVMSHLACADEPAHPLNGRQRESFQAV